MALFGLDKKVKGIVLDTLADGEIKAAGDKAMAEAVVRLLRGMADAIEKDIKDRFPPAR